ncbi:MAG: hypothetical protein QXU09_01145 [Thermoproteota archaeon]
MRPSKLKQLLLWELHDTWAFPFAEILIIGFFSQTLSITYIYYFVGKMSLKIFFATKYPVMLFCTLIPAKAFGECIEKRKVHIPLMAGASRSEFFVSKLVVTVLPIWVVQLGSLTFEAVLNRMFDMPLSLSEWISIVLGSLMLSLFVCSFSILLSLFLRKFSLSLLLGFGILMALDYWSLQIPFENMARYLSPIESAIVITYLLIVVLAKAMANSDVTFPMYTPVAYGFSIFYLLLLPILLAFIAALAFQGIDLD